MSQNLDHPTVSHVPGPWSSNSKSCVGWSRSWDMTYCWMIKVLGHDLLLDDQGHGTWLTVGWSRSWDMTYCWMIKVLGHDLLLNDQCSGTWLTVEWSRSWDMTYCWMIKVLGHDLLLDDQGPGTCLTVGWSRSWEHDFPTVSHVPGPWSSNSKSCPRTLIIQQ
jgi:hypothetical protein